MQKSFILLFSRLSAFSKALKTVGARSYKTVRKARASPPHNPKPPRVYQWRIVIVFCASKKKMIEVKNKSLIGSNDIGHSRLPLGLIWQVVGGNNRVLFEESAFVERGLIEELLFDCLVLPDWFSSAIMVIYTQSVWLSGVFLKCLVISDYVVLLYGFTTWITRLVTIYSPANKVIETLTDWT